LLDCFCRRKQFYNKGDATASSPRTPHLTITPNDAPGAIARLTDLGIAPFLLASSIIGVIAQRLIRTICKECAVPYTPTDEELEILFPKGNPQPGNLMKGAGCKVCKRSGYSGRIGVFEVLVVSDDVRELILKGAAPMEIRDSAIENHGMITLRQDGINKVLAGITTVEELNRVTFAD
jgi:type IV pilus assembly protein PilB